MTRYEMRGHDLYAHYRRVATVRGNAIYDDNDQRVATIRGNELYDADDRVMASIRGSDIYDAASTKVGSLSDVKNSIRGAVEGIMYVAMWYCFVR